MRAVVQRVKNASCTVEGELTGKIEQGLLILLGVGEGDTEAEADMLASKIAFMRIFCDENDKMNLSLLDIEGGVLVISQFTLYADCKKGRRPSFFDAAKPEEANKLYEYFCRKIFETGVKRVEKGIFGADMTIEPVCIGPVTIVLDTDELR